MSALVFVTTELSPFTAGGIGRALHNMLRAMPEQDRSRAVVMALDCEISHVAFAQLFPGARLVRASSDDHRSQDDDLGHHPPRRAYSGTAQQWKSAVILRALRALAQEIDIAYVEFPDWGALAFATLQEKRISGFLDNAVLAVRLHSSHAALLHNEARAVEVSDLILADMERKCLRDCDLVIAQLPAISEVTRQLFGFTHEEWAPRTVVHAPPVLLDHLPPCARSVAASADMPLAFGSKVQRVKRPDLFVRGAAGFMTRHPEYRGSAVFLAHRGDGAFERTIARLVPPDLSERFDLDARVTGEARERLIAGSVFIAPSDYESFCLSVYEASLLGARCILNAANPAFGDGSPWREGVNCYTFDGTTAGLVDALERSFAGDRLEPVAPPRDPWPWTVVARPSGRPRSIDPSVAAPSVSVIVPHFNLGDYLLSTITSILEQTYPNIEIIVVDDRSYEPQGLSVIEDLEQRACETLRVIRAPANVGLAGARNIGLAAARGEYVLPLDADDLIHPRFVETAVNALEANPEFGVFVTPAAYFVDGATPFPRELGEDYPDYAMFIGEGLLSGVKRNVFSTATAVFRADAIRRHGYRENLFSYEDWNLYLRMAQDGARFLVSNTVYFYYRNRAGSMIKEATDPSRHAMFMHDHLRTAGAGRNMPLAYLAFLDPPQSAAPPPTLVVSGLEHRLDRLLGPGARRALDAALPPRARRAAAAVMHLPRRRQIRAATQLIAGSPLFDAAWYLRVNADVAATGVDPALHYVLHGAKEGRDPSPAFSTNGYLAANPDVMAAGHNPLLHYIRHGKAEGRLTRPG